MADESEKGTEKSSEEESGASLTSPPPAEEDEGGGLPGWMATFADLVTLLMCFFVLLFAMSSTQEESFKQLVESLKSALGVQSVPEAGTREGLTMVDVPEEKKEEKEGDGVDEAGGMVQKEVEEIVSDVQELIMFNKLAGLVNVQENEMGATITIADALLFPAGKSNMSKSGVKVMEKISQVLSQFSYHTKIAGHTDNTPIHTVIHPSNWELSADRACEVVRFMAGQGLDPKKMSAEGYGEYRPIADNNTLDGRAKNRRVEIVYERQNIAQSMAESE